MTFDRRAARERQLRVVATTIAVIVPFAFLALGVVRAWPFVDDVRIPTPTPDDWHTYKQLSLSVVHDGLSMPALTTTFAGLPHGFLYIYFLAFVFDVAGVNSAYVYVVQSLLLGVSVSLTYVAVRDRLTAAGACALIVALSVLMYVDVFRHLTFKLLSEDLYFVLFPVLLLCLLEIDERRADAPKAAIGAGIMLGLVILTRPSFIMAAALVLLAIWIDSILRRRGVRDAVLMTAACVVVLSAVSVRNLAATGHASFDIVTENSDWLRPWTLPFAEAVAMLVRRGLFVLGFTPALHAAYRARPHWVLLWLAWAAYPLVALRRQRTVPFWEVLLYLYVIGYIGPVFLVAADITSYGGRMVIVVLPILLLAAVRLVFGAVDEAARPERAEMGYVRH